MTQNKSPKQTYNAPIKTVINIGKFTLNTRIAWSIALSMVVGAGALTYHVMQPGVTINNPTQTTNVDNSQTTNIDNSKKYLINNPPATAPGEKPSAEAVVQAKEKAATYRQATQQNPNDATAWTNLGEALRRSGDLPGAQQAQEKALQINPKLTEAKLGLALVEKDQGKTAEVISELKQLAETETKAIVYFYLGYLLYAQKDLSGAVEAYQTAIRINPNLEEAHNNLGGVLYSQGKLDSAIESSQTAIRINPNLAEAHSNLGNALFKQGKLDSAIESYQTAIRINPNLAEAHSNLGNALSEQGKLDSAIESYQTEIRINPNLAEAHSNLGNALSDQGKLDRAIDSFQTAIHLNPNLAEARLYLGIALAVQNQKSAAIYQIKQARSLYQQQGDTKTITKIDRLIQKLS